MSIDGVAINPDKVKVMREWLTLNTIHETRSFHGLTLFIEGLLGELVPLWLRSLSDLRKKNSNGLNLLLKLSKKLRRY